MIVLGSELEVFGSFLWGVKFSSSVECHYLPWGPNGLLHSDPGKFFLMSYFINTSNPNEKKYIMTSFASFLFATYYVPDQISDIEMGWARGTNGRGEKFLQNFGELN